jgi:hypothetical protein
VSRRSYPSLKTSDIQHERRVGTYSPGTLTQIRNERPEPLAGSLGILAKAMAEHIGGSVEIVLFLRVGRMGSVKR